MIAERAIDYKGVRKGDKLRTLNAIDKRVYRLLKKEGLDSKISQDTLQISEYTVDLGRKVEDAIEKVKGQSDLEGRIVTTAILGFVLGIFFLSPSITGNVIANLSQTTSNSIGFVLLLIGLISGILFYFRKNSRK